MITGVRWSASSQVRGGLALLRILANVGEFRQEATKMAPQLAPSDALAGLGCPRAQPRGRGPQS